MAKKPPKPYNWMGAAKVNWFPNGKPQAGLGASLLEGIPKGNPFAPQGGGGQNPYAGLINEYLNQQRAAFAAQGAADAASRDAALRKYVISYGQVPDFAKLGISDEAKGFWEKAINDKTKALALQNEQEGTSIHARMAAANAVRNRQIPAQLAARGLLRSGQTGADLRDQAQQYKIQGFDTLNEMLGGVESTVGNYLQSERERQMALAQAEMEARMQAMQDWGGDMYGDGGGGFDPFAGLANLTAAQLAGLGRKKTKRPPPKYPRARGAGGTAFRTM